MNLRRHERGRAARVRRWDAMKAWIVVLAACGSPSMNGPDAPGACEPPALDAPWLRGLLADSVGALAATPRATIPERDAARAYLSDQLRAIGWDPALHTYATGANVHATIPSTTGGTQQIIVGAHFDGEAGSPAANDNASGVAAVLAVARYLRDVPCRDVGVTVVLFDQEEAGLVGSRAYAATVSTTDVRGVYTIDQVSWDGDGDRVFELEMPSAALEQEYRAAAAVVGVSLSVTSMEGTDHESFRDRGIAAVGLTEEYVGGDTSPHNDRATDTAATVNLDYLELAARLAGQVIVTAVAVP